MTSIDDARSSNQEIIGRADVNDLEAILAVTNTDVDEVIHTVKDNADAIFTWDYEKGAAPGAQQALREGQDARSGTARPTCRGTTEVDQEDVVHGQRARQRRPRRRASTSRGTPFAKWGDKEWLELGIESQNWTLSASSCTASRAR